MSARGGGPAPPRPAPPPRPPPPPPRAAGGGARREAAPTVRLKRAYEEPERADGYRVLVDRLWPRGVRKGALAVDAWLKEIAPSDELRRWFGHDAARWEEFARRYRDELGRQPAAGLVAELAARSKRDTVTLVYGAKDEVHNQAVVLREVLERRLRGRRARAPAARPVRRSRPGGRGPARDASAPARTGAGAARGRAASG